MNYMEQKQIRAFYFNKQEINLRKYVEMFHRYISGVRRLFRAYFLAQTKQK